ncbi:1,2-phenylacetyl-CoA epoxidase subunit PaaC [Camelliibacillus cellulosilyticus]|uniref:1,2-phenylacetyl-CoA epoxidase subunit PaaC n=1 Tax=Camelliibacillus cellulosilyticus TaxID=2174486 RepID=A0ABV9GNH5_9BACL
MTPEYKEALIQLLYQLADDNFIHAFRGSEWLGLAPHIEEDVAFSSINQDTMGHAVMYYRLLEALGEGQADDLAHKREARAFHNAVLLEFKNGKGEYLQHPEYDWAFTVVRHLVYAEFKKVRLDALALSSYEPLAETARKIKTEHYYHLMHWETWFTQLMSSTREARQRMTAAIERVWDDLDGLFTLGSYEEKMLAYHLVPHSKDIKMNALTRIQKLFDGVNYPLQRAPEMKNGNGRNGEHTSDLDHALSILSEVYRSDPLAKGW